ncbi:MAG: hypothetical protein AAFQ35_06235, partial [Pseudomonadota bacterium]
TAACAVQSWSSRPISRRLRRRLSAPDLDDELNKRAWRDTLRRFALRPRALDRARYARFAAFLTETKLIDEALAVDQYAVEIGR